MKERKAAIEASKDKPPSERSFFEKLSTDHKGEEKIIPIRDMDGKTFPV